MNNQGYMQSGKALNDVLCCDSKDRALDFANIAHACWLAIVTMTTVGYGEKYPKTLQGRIVGVMCMFLGILLIALPTAIVGQNFQEVYRNLLDQQARQLKKKSSKVSLSIGTISAMKTKASAARRASRELDSSPTEMEPHAVSWKRIEIISERSNARKEKLQALQAREQRIQEQLKTEIRSLV